MYYNIAPTLSLRACDNNNIIMVVDYRVGARRISGTGTAGVGGGCSPRRAEEIENIYLTEANGFSVHSHWTSGQLTCRAAEAESTRRRQAARIH